MIAIDLKRTKATDLEGPVLEYLGSNHNKDEVTKVKAAVSALGQKRQSLEKALSSLATITPEEALQKHEDYYSLLDSVSKSVPFGYCSKPNAFVRMVSTSKLPSAAVSFPWADSFRPRKSVSSYDVGLEKAAVLFNVGAAHTKLAVQHKKGNDTPAALKSFRAAAGVFEYLLSPDFALPSNLKDPYRDLSQEALDLCRTFCLAQAQTCLCLTAIASKKSSAVIAKLVMGAAQLYGEAYKHARKDSGLSKWLSGSDCYDWKLHCIFQELLWRARGYFWHSKDLGTSKKPGSYGEEIGFLQKAQETLKACAPHSKSISLSALLSSYDELQKSVNARLAECEKDNSVIYHERVPNPNQLSVSPIVMAKSTPFDASALAEPNQGIIAAFQSLIPAEVVKHVNVFSKHLEAKLQQLESTTTNLANAAQTNLQKQNLPAALDAVLPEVTISDNLFESIAGVQRQGGYDSLLELQKTVQASSKDARDLFAKLQQAIKDEAKVDQEYRLKFKNRWNRLSSAKAGEEYTGKLAQYEQSYLKGAGEADTKVQQTLVANENNLRRLAATREQLDAELPKIDASGTSAAAADELRGLLKALDDILASRAEALQAYKDAVQLIDMKKILMDARGTKTTAREAFDQAFGTLKPLEEAVLSSVSAQKESLDKITAAKVTFDKNSKKNAKVEERELFLQTLHTAVNTFNQISKDLNDGLAFYTNFYSGMLSPMLPDVEGFAEARKVEADMLQEQLTAGKKDREEVKHDHDDEVKDAGQPVPPAQTGYVANPNYTSQLLPASQLPAHQYYQQQGQFPPQYGQQPPLPQYGSQQSFVAPPPYGGYQQPPPQYGQVPPQVPPQAQPQAPPQQPRAPSQQGWACPACTFLNNPVVLACQVCNSQRPH